MSRRCVPWFTARLIKIPVLLSELFMWYNFALVPLGLLQKYIIANLQGELCPYGSNFHNYSGVDAFLHYAHRCFVCKWINMRFVFNINMLIIFVFEWLKNRCLIDEYDALWHLVIYTLIIIANFKNRKQLAQTLKIFLKVWTNNFSIWLKLES